MLAIDVDIASRKELEDGIIQFLKQMTMEELRSTYKSVDNMMAYHDDTVPECPYCHAKKFVRNGHKHGKQAYLCRCCGKSFVSTTGTLEYRSHLSKSDWAKAIDSTLKGDSLVSLCEELDISEPTAFRMRHKILRALEIDADGPCASTTTSCELTTDSALQEYFTKQIDCAEGNVTSDFIPIPAERALVPIAHSTEGATPQAPIQKANPPVASVPFPRIDPKNKSTAVMELDETFVLDNYKGTRIPAGFYRGPRERNGTAIYPGISFEQVCICASVEREGGAYAKTINRAKPSNQELKEVFESKLKPGTLILCDGLKGYNSLSRETGCDMCDVNKAPQEESNVLNLNKVNNFHSMIKERHRCYRGVATKYQNRYNVLYSTVYKLTSAKKAKLIERLLTSRGKYYRTNAAIQTANILPLGDISMDPLHDR